MSMGERGKRGDHGQSGDKGDKGAKGDKGDTGVAPWVVRNATAAYIILCLGVALALFLIVETKTDAFNKIEQRRIAECQAGNVRSELQLEDYRSSLRQAQEANIERILGLTKEQADELRRISVENAERRISQVPFTDCATGERLPPRMP